MDSDYSVYIDESRQLITCFILEKILDACVARIRHSKKKRHSLAVFICSQAFGYQSATFDRCIYNR